MFLFQYPYNVYHFLKLFFIYKNYFCILKKYIYFQFQDERERSLFDLIYKTFRNLYSMICKKKKSSWTYQIDLGLTTIGVSFGAVTVLQTAGPRALVSCCRGSRLPDPVSTLEPLSPFSPVKPAATCLHTQTVPFAVLPLSFVSWPTEMQFYGV